MANPIRTKEIAFNGRLRTYEDAASIGPNDFCTLENLRQAITMGGTLGLGTFRPFLGRYELIGWQDITKERN